MKKIWDIYKKYEEIINYLIVGVLTTVVSIVSYIACTVTFCDPSNSVELQIANIISWVIAVTFAYFTNRIFVFKSKNKNKIREAASFVGARVATLFMDMFVMFVIVTLLGLNDLIGKCVSQVVVTIANYILSKLFVFKKEQKN